LKKLDMIVVRAQAARRNSRRRWVWEKDVTGRQRARLFYAPARRATSRGRAESIGCDLGDAQVKEWAKDGQR
jgi:hypothetical protein